MSAKVTAKAVSQVRNQLPAFIGDEFPLYQKFMEHYYEFLEAVCIYYTVISDYGSAFTVGETVTGQTSGATATVKGTAAFTSKNKIFNVPYKFIAKNDKLNKSLDLKIVSKKIGCSKKKLVLLHQIHSNKFNFIQRLKNQSYTFYYIVVMI